MIVKCDVYTDATYVFFPDLVQLSGKYGKAAPEKFKQYIYNEDHLNQSNNHIMFITPTHINFSLKHCYNHREEHFQGNPHNGPWLQKVKQTNKPDLENSDEIMKNYWNTFFDEK